MTADIVDFESAKDRRTYAEINADQAEWEAVRDRLAEVMSTTGLSDSALTSATMNALVQMAASDLDDVKALIARCLKAFRE